MCETTETLKKNPQAMRQVLDCVLRLERLEQAIRDFLERGGGDDSSVGNAA